MIFNQSLLNNNIIYNGINIEKVIYNGIVVTNNNSPHPATLTNLLNPDGNFSKDTNLDGVGDGWSQYGMSAMSIVNNIQSFTPTMQYASLKHTTPSTIGHVFYYCAFIKSSKTGTRLCIQVAPSNQSRHTGSGNFELKSIYFISQNQNSHFTIDDDSASSWGQIQVKNCFAFDLTSYYGVGAEPTKQYMDVLIQNNITQNGYF
jgi:hypothetical protein